MSSVRNVEVHRDDLCEGDSVVVAAYGRGSWLVCLRLVGKFSKRLSSARILQQDSWPTRQCRQRFGVLGIGGVLEK